jgi:ATP-dependent Zn protease
MKSKGLIFILFPLFLLVNTGCKSKKIVSQINRTDSSTVISIKPVEVKIESDTVSEELNISNFTNQFNNTKTEDVILSKKGKRLKYQLKKVSNEEFKIEAVAEEVDSTVFVKEQHTTIKNTQNLTYERSKGFFEILYDEFMKFVSWLILIAILVYVVLKNIQR